jgi:N-acyl homoserine lactone hydrolase
MNTVDVLIQPVCLRFALEQDEVIYMSAPSADAQLDGMDRLLGIDPRSDTIADCNLGFLPVATTALVRGERTILVDPGNHHVGFYGLLGRALARLGLAEADVDIVVCTHSHHDHMGSLFRFPGADLVLGAGECAYAAEVYGRAEIQAALSRAGTVTEIPLGGELELCDGIRLVATPGHTPGHISLVVESDAGRVVIAGDAAMTRSEYQHRELSHWYPAEQRKQVSESLDRLDALDPDVIFPGHDRAFRAH